MNGVWKLTMFWQYICGAAAPGWSRLLTPAPGPVRCPVQVGLGRIEVAVAVQHHLVVLRHQRIVVCGLLASSDSSSSSAWELTSAWPLLARSGRLERGAAEERVDEPVQQDVVAAVVQHRGTRDARRVGRIVLGRLARHRVEQVLGGHVVRLVLVNHARSCCVTGQVLARCPGRPPVGTIFARGALGRYDAACPRRSSQVRRVLKKVVPLQNDTWPKIRPALAVDAVALV